MAWRAWHVYLSDYASLDRFLAQVIAPEIEALTGQKAMSEWFYIRYWENGPHVRLRLRDMDDAAFEALGARLYTAAKAIASHALIKSQDRDVQATVDGWHADPSMLPWFDQGSVYSILYEREFRRYGGTEGMIINEGWFGDSSRITLRIVCATLGDWARREAVALRLTAISIAAIVRNRDELVGFLSRMAANWRNFVPDAEAADAAARETYKASSAMLENLFVAIASEPASIAPDLPVVAFQGRRVGERLDELRKLANDGRLISPLTGIAPRSPGELSDALKSIIMSQVHMMNNRLGLTPVNEYGFARMLLYAGEATAS